MKYKIVLVLLILALLLEEALDFAVLKNNFNRVGGNRAGEVLKSPVNPANLSQKLTPKICNLIINCGYAILLVY